jgi:rod shape determining protein RodA
LLTGVIKLSEEYMEKKQIFKGIDFYLIGIVIVMTIFGVIMIASATNANELGMNRQVTFQMISFSIGLILMIIVMLFDYETMGELHRFIYFFGILFLLMVYIPGLGVVRGGARSWIDLGFMDIQTSEPAKLAFILAFSRFMSIRDMKLESFIDLILPTLMLLPYLALLILQPDLGSALVFVLVFIGIMFVSGIKLKHVIVVLLIVAMISPFAYNFLEPHQKERLEAFMNPSDPTLKGYYHVQQSKITIGSGQVFGRGLFEGIYHRYDYLPVQETDFIYAVICEELGFFGGAGVLIMYFLFLTRLIRISFVAKDAYGRNIVIGVLFMFAFQIFENIGMTMGALPVTGVTLPFISYGGSSMITSMVAVGLVLNVFMHRKKRGLFS